MIALDFIIIICVTCYRTPEQEINKPWIDALFGADLITGPKEMSPDLIPRSVYKPLALYLGPRINEPCLRRPIDPDTEFKNPEPRSSIRIPVSVLNPLTLTFDPGPGLETMFRGPGTYLAPNKKADQTPGIGFVIPDVGLRSGSTCRNP